MHYKKTDEYRFGVPKEYKACLAFKERLRSMGVRFYEESGNMSVTVRTYTHGDFEVDDKCDILELVLDKESPDK